MSEERLSVLRMLAEGKITAEQADELISALDGEPAAETADASRAVAPPPAPAAERPGAAGTSQSGFADLTLDQLTEFKMHGVDPAFIREMREIYPDIEPEQLIEFKIHGVSADFVRE